LAGEDNEDSFAAADRICQDGKARNQTFLPWRSGVQLRRKRTSPALPTKMLEEWDDCTNALTPHLAAQRANHSALYACAVLCGLCSHLFLESQMMN
jgi:hypothetical protein